MRLPRHVSLQGARLRYSCSLSCSPGTALQISKSALQDRDQRSAGKRCSVLFHFPHCRLLCPPHRSLWSSPSASHFPLKRKVQSELRLYRREDEPAWQRFFLPLNFCHPSRSNYGSFSRLARVSKYAEVFPLVNFSFFSPHPKSVELPLDGSKDPCKILERGPKYQKDSKTALFRVF